MRLCISYLLIVVLFLYSCKRADKLSAYAAEHITQIETASTKPEELLNFACSLEGTPYKAGAADPKQGFDCSGFIFYVFKHFGIMVPRMSVDFTPVQHEIDLRDAKPGDLILFTGTDSTERIIGHMGIVTTYAAGGLQFIHSASGKDKGVMESSLDNYFKPRYLKTIRIFPQNDQ